MLRWIQIRNFAIADQIELDFDSGLSVITGETGAGKSIIINALGLVLGQRAEASVIKHGNARAEVQAHFDIANLPALKAELAALALDEENECQLRRVILQDAPSKAYINGRAVSVRTLRQIGEQLMDIHSQHEHQSLLRPDTQRELLDKYAGISTQVRELESTYRKLHQACGELAQLRKETSTAHDKLSFLQYQVNELAQFSPEPDEWDALHTSHRRIHHQAELVESIKVAEQALFSGQVDTTPASSQLNLAISSLEKAQDFDAKLEQTTELLQEAQTLILESELNLRQLSESIVLDESELQSIEQRYAGYMELSRKHHVAPDDIYETYRTLLDKLERTQHPEEREQALHDQIRSLAKNYQKRASVISSKRQKQAIGLSRSITAAMQNLAMQGGAFEMSLAATPCSLDIPEDLEDLPPIGQETGYEKVLFKVSTNTGMPKLPLAKIASGGELSRISLGVQMILSNVATINTLVFDEVDVGVGGKTAAVIGKMLAKLGESQQILCITHLPQVASFSKQHYLAQKSQGSKVQLRIQPLSEPEKIAEIARMVGGETQTKESMAHARSLLQNSV